MSHLLKELAEKKLIQPPKWLPDNTHYLVLTGSHAYGVATDISDFDIYGFAIPPKAEIFPHLAGQIPLFGRQQQQPYKQYEKADIFDKDALSGKGREYDFTIYSIVRYFHLLMENNPNIIDSAFVPQDCVLFISPIGAILRENRKIFLHKGCWPKLKGYAYSQLHKMTSNKREGKRKELHERHGFDVKFAAHTVRLLYEAEMILNECDLDLRRNNEHIKAIRRGETTEQEIRQWAAEKEKALEKAYEDSKLPWGPDEPKIKELLLHCLEEHYGSLSDCVIRQDKEQVALREIRQVLDRIGY